MKPLDKKEMELIKLDLMNKKETEEFQSQKI